MDTKLFELQAALRNPALCDLSRQRQVLTLLDLFGYDSNLYVAALDKSLAEQNDQRVLRAVYEATQSNHRPYSRPKNQAEKDLSSLPLAEALRTLVEAVPTLRALFARLASESVLEGDKDAADVGSNERLREMFFDQRLIWTVQLYSRAPTSRGVVRSATARACLERCVLYLRHHPHTLVAQKLRQTLTMLD